MTFKGKKVRTVEYGEYASVQVPDPTGIGDGNRLVRIGVEAYGQDKQVFRLRLSDAQAFAKAILALTSAAAGGEGERNG